MLTSNPPKYAFCDKLEAHYTEAEARNCSHLYGDNLCSFYDAKCMVIATLERLAQTSPKGTTESTLPKKRMTVSLPEQSDGLIKDSQDRALKKEQAIRELYAQMWLGFRKRSNNKPLLKYN